MWKKCLNIPSSISIHSPLAQNPDFPLQIRSIGLLDQGPVRFCSPIDLWFFETFWTNQGWVSHPLQRSLQVFPDSSFHWISFQGEHDPDRTIRTRKHYSLSQISQRVNFWNPCSTIALWLFSLWCWHLALMIGPSIMIFFESVLQSLYMNKTAFPCLFYIYSPSENVSRLVKPMF